MTIHADTQALPPMGGPHAGLRAAAALEGGESSSAAAGTRGDSPEPAMRPVIPARPQWQARFEHWMLAAILPAATLAVVLVGWSVLRANFAPELPSVQATWLRAIEIFSAPFRDAGPNDKGIAWQLLYSLARVGAGFGLAVAVGLPVGFMLGMSRGFRMAWMPLIQVLRPVSPLAWLPIGLLLFKAVNPSAVFVIAITSIWPIILNVAAGVEAVPKDYLNVANILRLGRIERVRRIMLPATLPYVVTGMRLSLGTAWMVIVAAEMLTGGIGIGFYVWDEWNNLNVASIVVAIALIGAVGITLDAAMGFIQKRFDFTNA